MSLSDIVESWGAVEADFNRFYNVTNPLELTWRKFNILLFNLISEQSAFFRPFMDEAREITTSEQTENMLDSSFSYGQGMIN